ncbi:MAG: element excision factor XisI family protein [Chloroflexota bacterium]|nr:element excision factor XisI family protein [Chloroflexota bacterium]
MDQLSQIVREEVAWYASDGSGLNLRLFRTFDDEHHIYAVAAFPHPTRKRKSALVVYARIVDDVVVIEEDATDKPLIDKLMARGIPRNKIVLAYIDEPIPDKAKYDDDAFDDADIEDDESEREDVPAAEIV